MKNTVPTKMLFMPSNCDKTLWFFFLYDFLFLLMEIESKVESLSLKITILAHMFSV